MDDITKRFTYHPPTGEQIAHYEEVRKKALEFARYIQETIPDSRERSLAITKLEEVVFWTNAAIARNPHVK